MISVKNLNKDYNDDSVITHALAGVSLEIKKGELVSIMGPSGSGKSTLLHILSFLDRPTSGIYTFLGKSMENLSDVELAHIRNKEMGFVFQTFNLLGKSSVYENVAMPLLYSKITYHKRAEMIERAIEAVGLKDKLSTEAAKLSGGQKQRVAIARAIVNDPEVIFADEPTGNLDSKSGMQVMEFLKELNRKGRTIVLVTHDKSVANFARRLIKIKDGKIETDEEF